MSKFNFFGLVCIALFSLGCARESQPTFPKQEIQKQEIIAKTDSCKEEVSDAASDFADKAKEKAQKMYDWTFSDEHKEQAKKKLQEMKSEVKTVVGNGMIQAGEKIKE